MYHENKLFHRVLKSYFFKRSRKGVIKFIFLHASKNILNSISHFEEKNISLNALGKECVVSMHIYTEYMFVNLK